MLPPQKPWESATINQRISPSISNSDGLQSSAGGMGSYAGAAHSRSYIRNPPPLPPRPTRQTYQGGYGLGLTGSSYYNSPFTSYGGFGSGYNNYSSYGYNGYGNYSNYGSYNNYGGYGRFPHAIPESRFIQMAEDGTRPAFQSIESLVHAFGSVSFMLESTFNAMYSSFRAVLGVAENFGRLRALFGQFLSVFAVFRWLQWLYRKCLYVLGLQSVDPGREQLWRQASEAVAGGPIDPDRQRTSWPIMVFLGIILSGPYLMWKLLSSIEIPNIDANNTKDWTKCKEPILTSVALYDFAASSPQELSIHAGQKVVIAPKDCQQSQSWLLASVDGKKVGLVPANYIKILGRVAYQTKKISEPRSNTVPENDMLEDTANTDVAEGEPIISTNHIPGPSGDGLVDAAVAESTNNVQGSA